MSLKTSRVLTSSGLTTPFAQYMLPSSVSVRVSDSRSVRSEFDLPLGNHGESRVTATLGVLRILTDIRWFLHQQRVRIELTLHNPRRARHRNGLWDLGDPGSMRFRDWSVVLHTSEYRKSQNINERWAERDDLEQGSPKTRTKKNESAGLIPEDSKSAAAAVHFQTEASGEWRSLGHGALEIYQESSGGENWNSRNHVNRSGVVPMQFRGYRVRTRAGDTRGHRASPVIVVAHQDRYVACAVEEFWQQFPTAIETDGNAICVRMFPGQFSDFHELQAGEQNTRVIWLQYGETASADWTTLSEIHSPASSAPERDRLICSGITACLPAAKVALRKECRDLLKDALEGPRSFFVKREAVDEYGWRNYGDMWADHEGAYSDDPSPVISHYNNQYDLLYGLLVQYVATQDERWWRLADPLARHILDIDIYHTDRDKPVYNGGLFWHTNHYHDAGRATHRSFSASMMGKSQPSGGGGPSGEHNYGTGLLFYYQITGNRRAREAVLKLADRVIAMDDGRRHMLGLLSPARTGMASSTADPNYHGPGRGAGNSINVLLDGWMICRDRRYLVKLEEIIRRTIHPGDDLPSRNLDNVEKRWSYTVYLQALFRLLELTAGAAVPSFPNLPERNAKRHGVDLSALRSYARDSLLRYARWMADHESLCLDYPNRLEFPTETWAAQDLRKGNTLLIAALLTAGEERRRFIARGREILDSAWCQLMGFDSRVCTRPLAIVLQQCCLESFLSDQLGSGTGTDETNRPDYGLPAVFESQKSEIRRRARSFAGTAGLLLRAMRPSGWSNAFRQTWVAERIRCTFERKAAAQ